MKEDRKAQDSAGQPESQPQGGKKFKLDIIREQLLANPNLFYAGELQMEPGYYCAEPIHVFVSPKEGIYDIEGLNTFMKRLISGILPSYRAMFRDRSDGGVGLGFLCFEEPIGRIRIRTITDIMPIDLDALRRNNIKPGRTNKISTKKIMRGITIRVFPHLYFAEEEYANELGIINGTIKGELAHSPFAMDIPGEQMVAIRNMPRQNQQNI